MRKSIIFLLVGAFFAGALFSQPAHADHNDGLFFNAFENLIATMSAFNTLLTTVFEAMIQAIANLQTQVDDHEERIAALEAGPLAQSNFTVPVTPATVGVK